MIRRATSSDIDALVDLRAVMFATMGHEVDPDAQWRREAARWFAEHLDVDACAYVVRVDGATVAAALGYFHTSPPSPSSGVHVTGHVSNVVTREGHRRRGYGRTCVQALINWFRDETPVQRVDLAASEDGLALYESLGWVRRDQPTLRLSISRGRSNTTDLDQ